MSKRAAPMAVKSVGSDCTALHFTDRSVATRPVVYVASYPRSGAAFLSALLRTYVEDANGAPSNQQIANFDGGRHNKTASLQPLSFAVSNSPFNLQHLTRTIKYTASYSTYGQDPVLFKTNSLYSHVCDGFDFKIGPDDKLIYIVRHPLDVIVSAARFLEIDMAAMADLMLIPGAHTPKADGYFEVTGSWRENVCGWLAQDRCSTLLIYYEDLCKRPGRELERVIRFLGQKPLAKEVRQAVRRAASEHLRQPQAGDRGRLASGQGPRAAIKAGQPGQWRTALPNHLALELESRLDDVMSILGYYGPKSIQKYYSS